VVEGLLEERAYMSGLGTIRGDSGIELRRGGVVLLNPGAVTTFVPNPDYIHMTGAPALRPRCISLHLYGWNMDSFHVYDVERRTRRMIHVPTTRAADQRLRWQARPIAGAFERSVRRVVWERPLFAHSGRRPASLLFASH
jgi:hypothetical protein